MGFLTIRPHGIMPINNHKQSEFKLLNTVVELNTDKTHKQRYFTTINRLQTLL